jgi:hypothetical protein
VTSDGTAAEGLDAGLTAVDAPSKFNRGAAAQLFAFRKPLRRGAVLAIAAGASIALVLLWEGLPGQA